MAYTTGIPLGTDRPYQSRLLIKDNFDAINTIVAVNHVPFDDSSGNQGKHKFLQLPEQSAAPTTAANEAAFYAKEGAKTLATELVFKREGDPASVIEMTARGGTTSGWTMLPSGLLLKWDTSTPFTGESTITYLTGATIPVFSAIYTVLLTPESTATGNIGAYIRLRTFNTTSFVAYVSGTGALAVKFLAIGLP